MGSGLGGSMRLSASKGSPAESAAAATHGANKGGFRSSSMPMRSPSLAEAQAGRLPPVGLGKADPLASKKGPFEGAKRGSLGKKNLA